MNNLSEQIHSNYIKSKLRDDFPLTSENREWLIEKIEQAERAQELEKAKQRFHDDLLETVTDNEILSEALEWILVETEYSPLGEIHTKARKALEDVSDV